MGSRNEDGWERRLTIGAFLVWHAVAVAEADCFEVEIDCGGDRLAGCRERAAEPLRVYRRLIGLRLTPPEWLPVVSASASAWQAKVALSWQYGLQAVQPLPVSQTSKNWPAPSLIVMALAPPILA